jgi:1,2-diacylglycerol 3-alpha-glucosyltransferase
MDYFLQETASLPDSRPFPLIVGETDDETPAIRSLATKLFGETNFDIRTVAAKDVMKYLRASDAFALGSLREGLPRVLLEAMSQGLPCLVHDYRTSRFVLGDFGTFGDFTRIGSLSSLLSKTLLREMSDADRGSRHAYIYKKFSWSSLRPAYAQMIQTAACR